MSKPSRIEIGMLVVLALLFFGGVIYSFIDDVSFKSNYVNEDGFVEWMTVVGLLCSSALCAKRFVALRDKRGGLFLFTIGFLTLFFFFGAGEEISWGQRIFHIESSEFFKENNAQAETNLHNLVVGDTKINKLIFGIGMALVLISYLAILTPLYHRNEKVRRFLITFGVPIPRGYHIIAYVTLMVVVELVMVSSKKAELTEFVGSFIVFMNLLNPHNREIFDPRLPQPS